MVSKTLESTQAKVTFNLLSMFEDNFSKIKNLKTDTLLVRRLTEGDMQLAIHNMSKDYEGVSMLYDEEIPEGYQNVSDYLAQSFNSIVGEYSRDLFGIYSNKNLIGIALVTSELTESNIAPYVFQEHRGQGFMKEAYLALAEMCKEILGKPIIHEEIREENVAMQSIVRRAGMELLNDAPCSSLNSRERCDIFYVP